MKSVILLHANNVAWVLEIWRTGSSLVTISESGTAKTQPMLVVVTIRILCFTMAFL